MGEGSWRREQESPKPMFDQSRARGITGLLMYEMDPGGKWRFRTRLKVVLMSINFAVVRLIL